MRSLANRSWLSIEAHPPTLHSQPGLGRRPLLTEDLDNRFEMHARAALLSRLTLDWASVDAAFLSQQRLRRVSSAAS